MFNAVTGAVELLMLYSIAILTLFSCDMGLSIRTNSKYQNTFHIMRFLVNVHSFSFSLCVYIRASHTRFNYHVVTPTRFPMALIQQIYSDCIIQCILNETA